MLEIAIHIVFGIVLVVSMSAKELDNNVSNLKNDIK